MKLIRIEIDFIIFISVTTTLGVLRRIIPTNLEIQEGEDMQLRLLTNFIDEDSCYLRTPWHKDINLKIEDEFPEDDRIKYWSENNKCGVIVKNVRKLDEGWWKLRSKDRNSNKTIIDAANVKILDKINSIEKKVSILSGWEYQLVLAYGSKFCKVTHPSLKNELVEIAEENCKIDLNKPTVANAGSWKADVGIKGKFEEIPAVTNVIVSPQEQIIFGYKQEAQLLHLYCNLSNYDSVPDLCRFSQMNKDQKAFQISEGLRKGRFGYYGNGLDKKECGLTIKNPKSEDFGTWHCLTGKIGRNILGAYINVPNITRSIFFNEIIVEPETPVITTFSKELTLKCTVQIPLRYCWFSGPNETILTPSDKEGVFYSGECSVTIKSAKEVHNGTWTCHMGPNNPDFEYTADIDVRISETPLAAINKIILIENIRDSVSLQCKTVPNAVTLKYCRFFSPSGIGIHINEDIKEESSLEHGTMKIWFSGINTKMGDCGITLKDISMKEIGIWKCAGRLEGDEDDKEVFDTINVSLKDQEESENLTVGASVGIIVGVVFILITISFGILYLYKKYKKPCLPNQTSKISSAESSPRVSQGIELLDLH